ncbi:MAG TPA: hypothetical protein VFJ58_29610 [Armatimonadota bacterium]|nr:hypothetical protein [Armatimonadota bacterium]
MKQHCKSNHLDDPASLAVIAIATGLLAPLALSALLSVFPTLAPPRYHPPAHWAIWWFITGSAGLLFAGAGALIMAFRCPPRLRLLFWLIAGVVISPLIGPLALMLVYLPDLPSLRLAMRYETPNALTLYLIGNLVVAVAAWAIEKQLASRNRRWCETESGTNPAVTVL